MKLSQYILAGTAAVLVVGVSPAALAADDLCKNVSFRFSNDHRDRRAIKVIKVQYHNVVNDRNPTVELTATECNFGATCTTPGVDLKDVEGNNIKDIKFEYRYKERDGDWSDRTMLGAGPYSDSRKECRANKTYGQNAPFVITGKISVSATPVTNPNRPLTTVTP